MRGAIFLSTDQIEPALRNEFWRAVSRPVFDVLPAEAGGALRGSVLARPIGRLTIAATHFNGQLYRRDRQIIVGGGLDHYLLQLIVAGTMKADCDGTSISAGPGDICLFDLARTYTSDAEPGVRITLAIPRERIDGAAGGRTVHGLLLGSASPLTRLLRGLILDLHQDAGEIGAADAAGAEMATVDFISAIVANKVLKSADAPERTLRQHMLGFIDAHMAEPELGTAMLMRQFQISRAHLYRVFAADGGVATVIRERRLDAAYRRLKSEEDRSHSITELAYALGFTSSGQFSRAFRTRFGASPREIRSDPSPGNRTENEPTLLQSHFTRQARRWFT